MKNLLALVLLITGCSTRIVEIPTKAGPIRIQSTKFGTNERFTDLDVKFDGVDFHISGYNGDQVSAIKAAAEGAAAGAMRKVAP